MKLFITDDFSLYKLDNSPYKLLYQDCYFKESKGFDRDIVEKINYSNNDIDYRAATLMFPEMYDIINKLGDSEIDANRFIKTRKKMDRIFTLLYPFGIKYLLNKYELLISLKNLIQQQETDFSEVNINLSDIFKLAEADLKTIKKFSNVTIVFRENKVSAKAKFIKFIKNYFYVVYHLAYSLLFYLNKPEIGRKKHIMLMMYDVSTDFKLLETFFELIKNNDKYHLSIVQIESGNEKKYAVSAKYLECKNISVYKFQDFRKGSFANNNLFFDALEKVDKSFHLFRTNNLLENINLHYEWMDNAIEKLNPDICLYDNQGEMGRVLSDVSRFQKKPSVCVEYSFTFDGPFLKQNVHFTARACINDYTAKNYLKHNDPTNLHPVIGFCKLDSLKDIQFDKAVFFPEQGFDLNEKTIFFASTWSSENKIFEEEKSEIVKDLSDICHKNNWNLIIKKHPSEFDSIVDDVLKRNPLKNQKVFTHDELPLGEAVILCDFMCCQSSSAVLEAIYFGKPFCYLSKANVIAIANYSVLSINDSIPTFNNVKTFEAFIKNIFSGNDEIFSKNSIAKMQENYLFKTDGMASQRLLDILATINFIE